MKRTFFILGSSGGLGSFLVKSLRNLDAMVYGIDLHKAEYTDFLAPSADISLYVDLIRNVLSRANGPVVFVLSVASTSRLKGGAPLHDLIKDAPNIYTESQVLLSIALALVEYSESSKFVHHIINIGSVLSEKISLYESPVYAASKASALAVAKYLAVDLSPYGIKVNTISPCLMARNTAVAELLQKNLAKSDKNFSITSYEDVLRALLFVVDSGISSLNGSHLILDDGIEHIETYWSLSRT